MGKSYTISTISNCLSLRLSVVICPDIDSLTVKGYHSNGTSSIKMGDLSNGRSFASSKLRSFGPSRTGFSVATPPVTQEKSRHTECGVTLRHARKKSRKRVTSVFFNDKKKKNKPGMYKRERGPGPSVTGVPFFFFFGKRVTQQNKQNNVTDVLLGLPAVRDGPCPTTSVLRRISHSFHRGCRIVGRIERLGRWRVDLGVSGHEAVWACLACL